MDVLNFDLGWILSTGCIVDVKFHGRMLVSTLVPIAVMIMIWGTYTVAVVRHSESEESLQHIRHKHMSAVILVTFLVYSSVSSAVLQMFDCEHLDDGNNYLRADYTILCDSLKHKALQVYAGVDHYGGYTDFVLVASFPEPKRVDRRASSWKRCLRTVDVEPVEAVQAVAILL